MALGQRRPDGVIHHSDHGSQYTSFAFGQRCEQAGVRLSMGSVGDCFDNAMCESFFATLECELLDRRRFKTQSEARIAIFEFIEGWYNPQRRHSALDYLNTVYLAVFLWSAREHHHKNRVKGMLYTCYCRCDEAGNIFVESGRVLEEGEIVVGGALALGRTLCIACRPSCGGYRCAIPVIRRKHGKGKRRRISDCCIARLLRQPRTAPLGGCSCDPFPLPP
jgi:hypothetical protein